MQHRVRIDEPARTKHTIRTEKPQSIAPYPLVTTFHGGHVMGMYRFLKISLVAAALVSTPIVADAADAVPAPVYRPAPPIIPLIYNWNGFYVGGHVGAGWSDGGDAGFLGGGQAGYNYQIGQWVLGAEWQMSATSIKDTVSTSFIFPGFAVGAASIEARLDWVSTFAARFGWAFDHWLVYGKVGGAWAHTSVDIVNTINSSVLVGGISTSFDRTVSGWMLGVGAEYALWDNWTAKVEYNMMDFGSDFFTDSTFHVVKAGVNYHFSFPRY
jgi:outer membrane immunogenic protein